MCGGVVSCSNIRKSVGAAIGEGVDQYSIVGCRGGESVEQCFQPFLTLPLRTYWPGEKICRWAAEDDNRRRGVESGISGNIAGYGGGRGTDPCKEQDHGGRWNVSRFLR